MSLEITIELWFFILLASKQLVVVKTSLRKIFHLLTSQVIQFDFHKLISVSSSMYIIVSSTNISLEGPSTSRFDNSNGVFEYIFVVRFQTKLNSLIKHLFFFRLIRQTSPFGC